MEPIHGTDPVHVRLARHAKGIGVLVAGSVVLGLAGVFPPVVPWWFPGLALLLASVLIAVTYAANPGDSRREVTARSAVQAVSLGVLTYATGWGFALPFVHLFGIADNIDEAGSEVTRSALGWAVGVTAVGQLAIQLGTAPLAVEETATSHLVAAVTVVLLVLVTNRLRRAAAERERARADLMASEARFRTLVEDAQDVVLLLDGDLAITYASPSLSRVLGHQEAAAVDTPYLEWVHPADLARVEAGLHRYLTGADDLGLVSCRLAHAEGRWVEVEAGHRDLRDDAAVAGLVVSVRDVSERNRLTAEIERRRLHDELTGLPNRVAFDAAVDDLAGTRALRSSVVLVLEVDGFGAASDAAGSQLGEAVVRATAQRLADVARDTDLVARIGDARFGVLTDRVGGEGDPARALAERLAAAVDVPIQVDGAAVHPAVAVGVASNLRDLAGRELLRCAGIALRAARQEPTSRGARVTLFDESMRTELVERIELERDLADGIRTGQLLLHYQPLVDLDAPQDAPPSGVEALVRWQHPTRGIVSPGVFIPIAEESGLIEELGWWVLDEALDQLVALDADPGAQPLRYVSVNVSMHQVAGGELVGRVSKALETRGLAPQRLQIELTETALVGDPTTTTPQLQTLAALGVAIAIDDFGTGYSSMAYLQQFPLDVLKIDRAFVSSASDAHRPELLASLIELGRTLGLRTVAEGIEEPDELETLRTLGCDIGQGSLLGRPAPAETLVALLTDACVESTTGAGRLDTRR